LLVFRPSETLSKTWISETERRNAARIGGFVVTSGSLTDRNVSLREREFGERFNGLKSYFCAESGIEWWKEKFIQKVESIATLSTAIGVSNFGVEK
jgi:hypothetical protein